MPEPHDELRRAREELARLADIERELVFWRMRAETAEVLAEQWRTVKNRSLWKVFAAVDQLRARVAPPDSRRERVVIATARRAARLLAPRSRALSTTRTFQPKSRKDVVFLYDDTGAWTSYRCHHQAEQLDSVGMASDIVQSRDVDLVGALDHYGAFVLNRVQWTDDVGRFVDAAERVGKRLAFDTDDLIFEPDLSEGFSWVAELGADAQQSWRQRFERYRKTLIACGQAIVSTEPLAQYARRVVDYVDVVPNAVSAELVRRADEALEERSYAERTATGRDVVIGYLSGSPGHSAAFREAGDAVLWALGAYPRVRFTVVGFLDLDERFAEFAPRITRIPKLPLVALPRVVARVDINLAPVERNPFTECKSCVKYLEAALVGVPTVASPLPDFVRVIDSGRNGFLADGSSAWTEALGELIESAERRSSMGALASDDVRTHHTTAARAPVLRRVLAEAARRQGQTARFQGVDL